VILRKSTVDKEYIDEILSIGRRHHQLGIYLYLLKKGQATLKEIHRIYNTFSGHRVTADTVKTSLRFLKAKGLVVEKDGIYTPIEVPKESLYFLFDIKRSRAGRIGAERSLIHNLYRKEDIELPSVRGINPNLRRKIQQVVETARDLVEKGDRATALDLVVHTLLPVRRTGVLWLWWGDVFIYYERKVMTAGCFHSVRFPTLAKLLKELGFTEGLMVDYILGSSRRYLRDIFGEENTYPYSRSIFYNLKKLGLVEPGPQYLLELQYLRNEILFTVKDIHGNLLQLFRREWIGNPPPPLEKEGDRKVAIALGVQHIYQPNESSYFSKFD